MSAYYCTHQCGFQLDIVAGGDVGALDMLVLAINLDHHSKVELQTTLIMSTLLQHYYIIITLSIQIIVFTNITLLLIIFTHYYIGYYDK